MPFTLKKIQIIAALLWGSFCIDGFALEGADLNTPLDQSECNPTFLNSTNRILCLHTSSLGDGITEVKDKESGQKVFYQTEHDGFPYEKSIRDHFLIQWNKSKKTEPALKDYMVDAFRRVPEGLTLIGKFHSDRPTIIYAHGWTPSEEFLDSFNNGEGWRKAGFNTLIFRWHRAALDLGTCPFLFSLPLTCPKVAEQRIWNRSHSVGETLVTEFKNFFESVSPEYNQEIRVTGDSLGAQLAVYLAYRMQEEPSHYPRPTRVELLDPHVGATKFKTADPFPVDSPFVLPQHQDIRGRNCSQKDSQTEIACVLGNAMVVLQEKYSVAVVIYGAVVSWGQGIFGAPSMYDLKRVTNYYEANGSMLCTRSLLRKNHPDCGVGRSHSLVASQHRSPMLAYFWSISEANLPQEGLHSQTSTDSLRTHKRWIRQKSEGKYCNSKFHGITLHQMMSGTFGRTSYSKEEYSKEIQVRLGISKADADQCANAISFTSDRYDFNSLSSSASSP